MKYSLKHSPKQPPNPSLPDTKPGNHEEPYHGLARLLSKAGLCSRTVAAAWIRAGRVGVDGQKILDPEARFPSRHAQITVDGQPLLQPERQVLMLHKPRGVVSTRSDEKGRPTVYNLLPAEPWLAPVGRLDQASSGLLLFSNDPAWAQQLLDPQQHLVKTYHVQIRPPLAPEILQHMARHSVLDDRPCLPMQIRELRCGGKTQWLEFMLAEGRNRQIRRLLQAVDAEVLRLIRVSMGQLILGDLASGQWRWLQPDEEALLQG
ncbi:pseudouridine synthase [Acidithiobacillus marinus]|uniref:Pseudouridine synthase n=1 Tax=Acidithiobacillus marinus TaxID=187490 RepID=A0A2I1DLL3_9PROT|nr:pseudouridine synthase [Acidithiobacillus marinus]PKY10758.1 pseudouridine synthase [Acidithiobacillus marinus]